jgi:hypothetical protein
MKCHKCGGQQEERKECKYCGAILVRFNKTEPSSASHSITGKKSAGPFVRIFRVFGFISLACLIVVLILLLRTPSTPRIVITPEDVQKAEAKVKSFQSSIQEGRPDTLQMNESELNGWLSTNLALNQPQGSETSRPQDSGEADPAIQAGELPLNSAELEQAQSSVHDVKAGLDDDSVRLYASFDFHGKDMLLELNGRVFVQDGYLRLAPTGGKLGSLPLPAAALQRILYQVFDSPQNKEKFKLPPEIQNITIENGQLIVSTQQPPLP